MASDGMQLCVNGKYIVLKGSDSMIVTEGRSFVPVRVVTELLGYTVDWDGVKKEVAITNYNERLKLVIGNKSYSANSQLAEFDVAPFIKNDLTYIPVRLLDSLNANIEYNKDYNTVIIEQKDSESIFNDNGIKIVSSTLSISDRVFEGVSEEWAVLEIEIHNNSMWDIGDKEIVLGIYGDNVKVFYKINDTAILRGSLTLLKYERLATDSGANPESHIKLISTRKISLKLWDGLRPLLQICHSSDSLFLVICKNSFSLLCRTYIKRS
jgi:hypothetical protein